MYVLFYGIELSWFFLVFLLCLFPDKKAYWITSMFGCLVPISSLQLSELLADRILMLLYRKNCWF